MTYILCAVGFFKKALHSKIDVFVKFESAINLEIRGQIKKKTGFLLFGSEPFRALGDLTWNDSLSYRSSASTMYTTHNINNMEALLRRSIYSFIERLMDSSNMIINTLMNSWYICQLFSSFLLTLK